MWPKLVTSNLFHLKAHKPINDQFDMQNKIIGTWLDISHSGLTH